MTDAQQQRLDRCIEFLRTIAKPADDEASEVHWIGARNADPDQGPSYCQKCCDELVDKMNAEHPEHEYLRDGGWGCPSDGSECCDVCGRQLRVQLTDQGVSSELDNWNGCRIKLRGKQASYIAFDLLAVLETAYMGSLENCPWLHDYQLAMIKNNQRDIHRLARRIDGISARWPKEQPHDPR